MSERLVCVTCHESYDVAQIRYTCDCGGLLEVQRDRPQVDRDTFDARRASRKAIDQSGVWRFREAVLDVGNVITHPEGGTRLYERNGIFFKHEGENPTGSFKDRGMTVAVSRAIDRGARALICASTGNTSASAAAYAARAGIRCAVVLPAGKIATGKLIQAFAHGAKIVAIDGNFDDALRIVRELGEGNEFAIVNSINPDRIAGQKTAAFEIIDQLGDAPDFHLLPVGNAGNITAYWAGYQEYNSRGRSTKLPAMIGFQAAGAAPIFHDKIVAKPETIASAIRIGNPASWKQARAALDESKGDIDVVTDEEILAAQSWLASNEGIFVEPASAARPYAGAALGPHQGTPVREVGHDSDARLSPPLRLLLDPAPLRAGDRPVSSPRRGRPRGRDEPDTRRGFLGRQHRRESALRQGTLPRAGASREVVDQPVHCQCRAR